MNVNKKEVSERAGGSLLDDPIPKHEISKGQKILKPSKLVKKIEKVVDWGKREAVVDDKLKDFKTHIANLYHNTTLREAIRKRAELYKREQHCFTLVESKSSLEQFARQYTIDGVGGYGPMDFLQTVKRTVINFLLTQKNIKMVLVLRCNMSKTNIATGETVIKLAYFTSFVEIVFQETDREELYQKCVDKMMESLAKFQIEGSGWFLHSIAGLDLHTVKYTPLKGSSFIKLPPHLAKKKAITNMKNEDDECFKWCVTRALNPVQNHAEHVTKVFREQAKKLVWDGIKFPMELKNIHRFETLNPSLAVNVYMHEGGLEPLALEFNQSPWLKQYIDFNTQKRTQAKNAFEKDFFKLMNNSVFGKTMENLRKRVDVRLITDKNKLLKLASRPTFVSSKIFNENLVAVHKIKETLTLNRPAYIGMCILDLSKTLMYNFHYVYIKQKYGNKAKLLFTDTDSLTYEIEADDVYKDFQKDRHMFDNSDYPENSPYFYKKNKKVIGKMKDEAAGVPVVEFIGLRSKMYSYIKNNNQGSRTAKGVKKNVIKKDIKHENYKDVLFNSKQMHHKMKTIRSNEHEICSYELNKVSLSCFDDKRYILKDGINSYAYGHYNLV
ncbi:hypothetical protein AWC38_SpisGene1938 [Stylophora pistillata]|uniref:DNA-directed DNA polymerase n=1 Tax=Stylophora pistillata TaxID=50429 RepID=A0A2B4SWL3_STYPI|nr:hypothetical protein AWC38_SpisGene1938 [Stylophora pistillata]